MSAELRRQMRDIMELQDDVRKQAFDFMQQVVPPIANRAKELRRVLSSKQSSFAGVSSTKHPIFMSLKRNQEELVRAERMLHALEKAMLSRFATYREIHDMKKSDSPYKLPGDRLQFLFRSYKQAHSPVGMSWDKLRCQLG